MIASLTGRFQERDEEQLVLEVGGVGYELVLPPIVWEELGEAHPGQELHFKVVYQASAQQPRPVLFGFLNAEQKAFFELLGGVPRMGGRNAARAMTLPVATLAQAIQEGNAALLARLPGVSVSGAEKLIAALRKKVEPFVREVVVARPAAVANGRGELREAVDFLEGMGVRRGDAQRGVEEILEEEEEIHNLQDVITAYFRRHQRSGTRQ